jgi:acyl-CoA reductase-like NAD-dependent aldehyde dehydrogenase
VILRLVSPFTGEVFRELVLDGPRDVERKLARARAAQRSWRMRPIAERARAVELAMGWFQEHGEEHAREITLQMGKPIREARREVATMLDRAAWCVSNAEAALASEEVPAPQGTRRHIVHEPLGVVLDVAAWNYPLLTAVNVIVPALLAGNAVLAKPSARTPLCGLAFEEAFASLPDPGLVACLLIGHGEVEALATARLVDHVVFTGSVEGGRQVYAAAAAGLVTAGMELGGKDAAYVAEDAELDRAAAGVVDGACYNAGQSCCAVERAYVHEKGIEEFLERAAEVMGAYRLGDPLEESTTLGPMATAQGLERLERQVADAIERGARLVCGGRRRGAFFEPTLLAEVPQEAEVMREESFGPVLPVRRVSGDGEALEAMNDSRYGLTASVWTRDEGRAERMAQLLEVGTVYRNRCDYVEPSLPWGGVKNSGFGASLSRYGFWQVTRRKGFLSQA